MLLLSKCNLSGLLFSLRRIASAPPLRPPSPALFIHSASLTHLSRLSHFFLSRRFSSAASVSAPEDEWSSNVPELEQTMAMAAKTDDGGAESSSVSAEADAVLEEVADMPSMALDSTASIPLSEPLSTSGMTERELLEEQRKLVHELHRQILEQKEMLNSIVKEIGALKIPSSSADPSGLAKYVKLARKPRVPTWSQWKAFIEHLKSLGCFEDLNSKRPDVHNIYQHSESVKEAMLKFSLKCEPHFSIRSLKRKNVVAIARYDCPFFDNRATAAQDRLNMFVQLDDKKFLTLHLNRQANLADVSRLIHSIAVSPFTQSDALPIETKAAILDLLQEMTDLSSKSLDIDSVSKSSSKAQGSDLKLEEVEKYSEALTADAEEAHNSVKVEGEAHNVNVVKQVLKDEDEIEDASKSVPHSGDWECPRCKCMNSRHKVKCLECSYKRSGQADGDLGYEMDKKGTLSPDPNFDSIETPKMPLKTNRKKGQLIQQQKGTCVTDSEITERSDSEDSEFTTSGDVVDYLDDIISSENSEEEGCQKTSSKRNSLSDLMTSKKTSSRGCPGTESKGRNRKNLRGYADDETDSEIDDQPDKLYRGSNGGSGSVRSAKRKGSYGDKPFSDDDKEDDDDDADNNFSDRSSRKGSSHAGKKSREHGEDSRSGRGPRSGRARSKY